MRRKGFQILAVVCVSLLVCGVSFAASTSTLSASATVTGPTGISPVTLRVLGTGANPSDWADTTNYTSLDFDPLTLLTGTANGIPFSVFLPNHFYSIDMAYTYGGGAAITQMSFLFTGTEPAGQPIGSGLGVKGTATLVKKRIVNGVEAPETGGDRIAKVLLRDVSTVNVLLTDIAQGWLRMYVGLVTKDPALPAGDIELGSEAQVFSPGDVPGSYTGSLTISSL
ncbi:MAG: hypothetical protein V1923_04065 [Candidatus Omnitrophota bacterium]